MIGKMQNKQSIVELLFENKTVKGDQEICNAFNNHFASVAAKVKCTIKPDPSNADVLSTIPRIDNNLALELISEIQICKIVNGLKPKKSCGIDDFSNVLLKRLVNVIKSPLCTVINKSLLSGVFPDAMKIAKVIPLFKGGDIVVPDNYRPISLLPVLPKILEKARNKQNLVPTSVWISQASFYH